MKFYYSSLLIVLSIAVDQVTSQSCLKAFQKAAGSTTVYPYAVALATSYKKSCSAYNLTVDAGGSGAGAKRVCGDTTLGPVDIGNMSRDWKTSEATKQSDGYTFQCLIGNTTRSVGQVAVANDAVVLIVKSDPPVPVAKPVAAPKPTPTKPVPAPKPAKPAPTKPVPAPKPAKPAPTKPVPAPKPARPAPTKPVAGLPTAACIKKLGCLSKDVLRWMYSNYTVSQLLSNGWTNVLPNSDGSDSTHLWSELDSACSAKEISIAGTDSTSGEYDFFKSSILTGTYEGFRSSFVPYVDKTAVNTYVVSNFGAIGFNNYVTALSTSPATTTVVPLKNSAGVCVIPNATTVEDLSYSPLGRQAYMNVLKNNCTGLKASLGYVSYAVSSAGQTIVAQNGGIALTTTQVTTANTRISAMAKCS
jgi:ABC-type phosphate transport system substrate-binding protein